MNPFFRGGLFCLALSLLILPACGADENNGDLPDLGAARRNAPELASAKQVAEKARGDVDCPAELDSPERAAGAPVDDVQGVRPGLTYDEAVNLVLCSDEMLVPSHGGRAFNIQTYGQQVRQGFMARYAEPEKSYDEIRKEMQQGFMDRAGNRRTDDMAPGQSKWYVATMGKPGEEKVIAVAREEWFAEGRNPPLATVEQALIKKYGEPANNQFGGQRILTWIYDPRGRAVTETSPLYMQCRGISDPDGGTSFTPDCGLVVEARVMPLRSNESLAQYLQVGVIDQANGYQAITGTEQALAGMDAERKALEVSEAAEHADVPEL